MLIIAIICLVFWAFTVIKGFIFKCQDSNFYQNMSFVFAALAIVLTTVAYIPESNPKVVNMECHVSTVSKISTQICNIK